MAIPRRRLVHAWIKVPTVIVIPDIVAKYQMRNWDV